MGLGVLSRGDIVQGDIVRGDVVRGMLSGGCCPGDIVRGDIVLEPNMVVTVSNLNITDLDIKSGFSHFNWTELNFKSEEGIFSLFQDLAARNVLVNSSLICKVDDSGLSREMEACEFDGACTVKVISNNYTLMVWRSIFNYC